MTDDNSIFQRVSTALQSAWPDGAADIREYLVPLITIFAESGRQDSHYLDELNSGETGKLASRIWEALLFNRLHNLGWEISGNGTGPDFLINHEIYVEAVAPQRADSDPAIVDETTFDSILLRWTSALRNKRNKHMSDIEKGYADPGRPFVIAINSCLFDSNTHGIGSVPLAAMAVLPFGDPAATVNVHTGEIIGPWNLQWRDQIINYNQQPVQTDSFLNDDYRCVSAVIGCSAFFIDEGDRDRFLGQPPYFIVHNPRAEKPLPKPWLPSSYEYDVEISPSGDLQLRRLG